MHVVALGKDMIWKSNYLSDFELDLNLIFGSVYITSKIRDELFNILESQFLHL